MKAAKENIILIERFRSGGRAQPDSSPTNPAKVNRQKSTEPGHAGYSGQARHHFWRGGMLFAGQDYAGAVREFDQGLALAPTDVQAHWQRGACLVYLNRIDEGLRAIERALEIEPNLVEAHSARGSVLVGLGRYEEGLREINRVLAVCPGDPQATYNKACAFARLGEPTKAIELLERAVASDAVYRTVARKDPHFDSLRVHAEVGPSFHALVGAESGRGKTRA